MILSNIERYYKTHSKFYDLTRWGFLFGRKSVKRQFPDLPDGSVILDLGCGTGTQISALIKKYPGSTILGIDMSAEMLKKAKNKYGSSIQFRNEYYNQNSFSNAELDLVVCSYSLTMFDDKAEILNTIKKHLKDSGYLVVVDFDSSPFEWFKNWMRLNHVDMKFEIFSKLRHLFPHHHYKGKKAYLGLYSYSTFWAEKTRAKL